MNPAVLAAIERALVAYVTAHPELVDKIVNALISRVLDALNAHNDPDAPVRSTAFAEVIAKLK